MINRCLFLVESSTWWLRRPRRLVNCFKLIGVSSSQIVQLFAFCLSVSPFLTSIFMPREPGLCILLGPKVWSREMLSIHLTSNCQVQKDLKRALLEMFRRVLCWAHLVVTVEMLPLRRVCPNAFSCGTDACCAVTMWTGVWEDSPKCLAWTLI